MDTCQFGATEIAYVLRDLHSDGKKLTNSRFIHLSTEPMPVGPDYPDIIEWPESSTETIVTPEIINDV